MSESNTIRWERGEDGVVVLTLDDPGQSANTMHAGFRASLAATVDRLEAERDDITGVVITSAKKTFFAGADLREMIGVQRDQAAELAGDIRTLKSGLRRLETLGKPVVAAINGAALGGGLEIALATHHRIVVDDPKIQLGQPEVQLGLLPGAGGIVRTVRMLGLVDALMQVLLQGKPLRPQKAKELGLVDELVATPRRPHPRGQGVDRRQPRGDPALGRQGLQDPGRHAVEPKARREPAGVPGQPAQAAQGRQLSGAAPHHVPWLSRARRSTSTTRWRSRTRYFVDLATGQVAKNMIQAFFFDLQRVNGKRGRPEGIPSFQSRKVVVLGAGMMGAAIAYVCAKVGIEVVLKDVSQEAADKGKDYSRKLLEKAVSRGRSTQEKADALLARITPTTDAAAADGADLVIEAVFEDPKIKEQVFAEIEPYLAPDALLGSNTSSLPITELAEGVSRPSDFIGLHFFSPVDKMPLLEIIRSARRRATRRSTGRWTSTTRSARRRSSSTTRAGSSPAA